MNKLIFRTFCAMALAMSPLCADSYEPIGQAAVDGAKEAKSSLTWQKIALISGIFAITIVTIVLVSQYNGHHKK